MKTGLQFLVTLLILISMIACQETTPKTETKVTDKIKSTITMKDLAARKMPPKDAEDWIKRWEENSASYMAKHKIEYFDMPLADLQAVVAQKNVEKARYYIALDSNNIQGLVPHLILVGLDKNNVPNMQAAYDYTNVCPPFCDLIPAGKQIKK